jgi:hypothetical protein
MARSVERLTESLTYVLKGDRALPVEQQTRFVLEPLKGPERMRVWDQINAVNKSDDRAEVISRSFQQARELVLQHLISVENFPVGKPKPWPKSPAACEEYLERLDDLDIYEIGNELRERSSIGKTPDPVAPSKDAAPEPVTDAEEEAKHAGNS